MVIPPLITFPHHEALATASAKFDAAAMGIILLLAVLWLQPEVEEATADTYVHMT